jgi:hypothetical protein
MSRFLPALRALACATFFVSAAASATADVEGLAKRTWIQVDSPNFRVISDQPEDVARQVVSDLEALRYFKIEVQGLRPLAAAQPLTIVALGHPAFAQLGFPASWAGVFQLSPNGYSALANIEDYLGQSQTNNWARTVVLHEYHHFLVRLTEETRAYPRWVDEGMADYWGTFNVDGVKARVGDRVSNGEYGRETGLFGKTGRASIDTRELMNTQELRMSSFYGSDRQTVGRFYSTAYFAVHYFNSTPELRAALERYLRMINLGYRQDRAAELAFKKTYAELDSDITKYVLYGMNVRVMSSTKEAFSFPKINPTVTRLDTPAVYAGLARVLFNFRIERPTLRALLLKNRQLNPQGADANVLPLLAGFVPSQEADGLEKRFPNHAALLTFQGEQLRRRAEFRADSGAGGALALLKQAREYDRRAIKADPGYPAAYLALGRVYGALPDSEALEEGVAGLDSASIYTRDWETFSSLANVYLRMNSPLAALPALRSAVAFSGPSGQDQDALLLDNLEILNDLSRPAKASAAGLDYPGETHYAGPVSNGKPDGIGKVTRHNGSYYEGSFNQGLPSGMGKLVSDNGVVYQGQFERGIARGKGDITFPAGAVRISYKGQVDFMKPSGKGELLTKEGRYEGQFERGLRHGQGEFTAAAKPVTLRGRWVHGLFEWPMADDVTFIGPVSANGLRHGKGVCRTAGATATLASCEYKDGVAVIVTD